MAKWKSWTEKTPPEVQCHAEVFGQTRGNHPKMAQPLGDGAYSNRALVDLTTHQGVECRFLLQRNVNLKSLGVAGWKPSLWGPAVNPQGWLAEYHLRSVSEVVGGARKIRQLRKILKRLKCRRETEGTLRAVTYNLRRLAYLRWIEPSLPRLPQTSG